MPRIRVRGGGPFLREPMTLELGPPGKLRLGDVIAFRYGDRKLAHRIVRLANDEFWTASDARPWQVEHVRPDDVFGKVTAVWSDSSATAYRIDGRLYHARGWLAARLHPMRAWVARARNEVYDARRRLDPVRRDRIALRMVAALQAAERGDELVLAEALDTDPDRLRAFDQRHHCLGIIGTTAQRGPVAAALPHELVSTMRGARLSSTLATSRMHRVLCTTIELLQQTGVPFALLKGAARVYAATPDAALHPSQDIDVLVREPDLDRVVALLRARGYRYGEHDDATPEQYRLRHHHAASLFPPGGEFPVEVHHALAPPGSIVLRTDWDALVPYFESLDGPAGEVRVLNRLGTALHLAIHAIGLTRLRDVALLARALQGLTAFERERLAEIAGVETRDPIRLNAALVLAARVAGVPWTTGPAVERYLRWALAREDMPLYIQARCESVETLLARPRAPWAALRGLVPWWSSGREIVFVPQRVLGRAIANLAAWMYFQRIPPGY